MPELTSQQQSVEALDQTSPELWPGTGSGVGGYIYLRTSVQKNKLPWNAQQNNKEHVRRIRKYKKLKPEELVEKVKNLYDVAFNLGVDEAKEMTRAKYLDVLHHSKY